MLSAAENGVEQFRSTLRSLTGRRCCRRSSSRSASASPPAAPTSAARLHATAAVVHVVVDHGDLALGLDARRGADAEHVVAVRGRSAGARLLAALDRLEPAREVPRRHLVLVLRRHRHLRQRQGRVRLLEHFEHRARDVVVARLEPARRLRRACRRAPPPMPTAARRATAGAQQPTHPAPTTAKPPPAGAAAEAEGEAKGRRAARPLGSSGSGCGDVADRVSRSFGELAPPAVDDAAGVGVGARARPPPSAPPPSCVALPASSPSPRSPPPRERRPGRRCWRRACRRGRRRASAVLRDASAGRRAHPFEMMLLKSRCACVPACGTRR